MQTHRRRSATLLPLLVLASVAAGLTPALPPKMVVLPTTMTASASASAVAVSAAPVGWPRSQEARLRVSSIGLDKPVFAGGQSTIDRGLVTHYVGPTLPRTGPGGSGVYWLAAHNGSHGSPFARLPYVKVGSTVRVTTRTGATVTYRIHRRVVVGTRITAALLYSGTGPRIVLQTCTGTTKRLLLFGSLVR
jgi:LPXTG-site transpeptidase (sortase) family protein